MNRLTVSLVQKYIMGLTGLGLALFVLLHMLGNLLIFCGAKSYNLYAHKLITNPFLLVFEVGLLSLFICHIILALVLSVKNKLARPQAYAHKLQGFKATAFYQKTLLAQGIVVFLFVIWHLITFKFGPYYETTYGETTVRDLFRLMVEVFQNPFIVGGYLLALLILSFHLFHGVASSVQSLGLHHPRFEFWIKRLSLFYTGLVTIGYMIVPLYIYIGA